MRLNIKIVTALAALLSASSVHAQAPIYGSETESIYIASMGEYGAENEIDLNQVSAETAFVSFNQNRRLSAYDGLSFDSDLGQLSLADGIAVNGFSRVNNDEQQFGVGLDLLGSRFTAMQGKGKGFSRMDSQYSNLDPYYFHGGTTARYRFNALEWSHRFSGSFNLQLGTSEIESDHLEDRDTHYVGTRIGAFSGHVMQVRRGGERAGETLSLAFDSPLGTFSWSALQQIAGGRMNQFAYRFYSGAATQYGLSFSTQENPLLDERQSYRVMLSFNRPIGKINHVSAAAEVEPEAQPQSNRNRNIAILGGAAVAAGLLISSGSDNQDRSIRLSDQHSAAREALNQINPKSVKENREYGGWVYETLDGRYTSTTPVAGTIDSVEIPYSLIPSGGSPLATYHTHGGDDPRYLNEQFSSTDIASDLAIGLDGYLGTPAGSFLWHDVRLNQITRLGSIAN